MNKKYWYKFTVYWCVLCGHETKYKERIYDKPKPDDYYERYIWIQTACSQHFI